MGGGKRRADAQHLELSVTPRRKGIILAGGAGSRLWPLTHAVSKQLMPVYDKPMIYYPLTTLMDANIRDIAIITTPEHRAAFEMALGDGEHWGITLTYITQPAPEGLAQAYVLAEGFLAGAPSAMILGDNIFYAPGLGRQLAQAAHATQGALVITKSVPDASRFGVVSLDAAGGVVSIEEKPQVPRSDLALTGLYLMDSRASNWAGWIQPSARGELEITALLEVYKSAKALEVVQLDPNATWFDTGTHRSLMEAGQFVSRLQARIGTLLGSPEIAAFEQGWITRRQIAAAAKRYEKTAYGAALRAQLAPQGAARVHSPGSTALVEPHRAAG